MFKVGDWVIGIPGAGVSDRLLKTPMYVAKIKLGREDDTMLYLCDHEEEYSAFSSADFEGWFARRFKLYNPGQRIITKKVRIA